MDEGEFGFGLLSSPLALGSTCPRTRCCSTPSSRPPIPDPTVPVVPLPLPQVSRHLRAPDRQPGVAPLRAVRRRRLRRPRRGRAGRAADRAARQLRLHGRLDLQPERRDPRRGLADRHRRAEGASARRRASAAHEPFGALVAPNWWRPTIATTSTSGSTSTSTAGNSFLLGKLSERPARRSAQERLGRRRADASSESEGQLDHGERPWKVVNPTQQRAGLPGRLLVESHGSAEPLIDKAITSAPASSATRCGSRARSRRAFAAGDTPNQNPGEPGLPQYPPTTRASSTPTSCSG